MAAQLRARVAFYCLFTLPLVGCGGGGGGNGDPPPPAPGGIVRGDTFAITSLNRLVSFNSATPANSSTAPITGLRSGENIVAFDLRPGGTPAGQMIALTNQGGLYTIDPNSATATLKSTLTADPSDLSDPYTSLGGTRQSIDVNNVADALRIVSNTGQNLRVNMDTGATFTDTALTVGGSIGAIGITEVAYTNNFTTACRTTPYYIDTTADRLMISANASGGVLTPVGGLTVDAAAMAGFDISTNPDGTNSAVAALTVAGTTSLYSIDLRTGAATVIGPIGNLNSGESILGIARPVPTTTPPQPLGELLALTESNGLISFNSGLPQQPCTTASINGLQGNETVLGLDMRPADNNVYALTSAGRLYTVNAATGTVAFRANLSASASDPTLPFQGLDGGNITVDVSPVADGLRVLSSNGQNLRVVFNTGETFTDTQLTAGSAITAAAYTNSFAGTGTSTLYVIDTLNDRLMIQGRDSGSPNNGDLRVVGSLRIGGDVQSVAGFDINAVNNAAFAALNVGSNPTSDLYSINLIDGSATRLGPIGTSGRIRALTYTSVPQASLLGVTRDGRLVSFRVTSPGTFDSNMAISGLQGGEQVLGFDIRPSNGLLYLLTDAGRLYTVDPATARAQLGATLMPNTGDPFRGLIGTAFGTDFSPTADALRVISDAEHNLAVIVETGATITAQFLRRIPEESGRPSPDVVAIAYTSNFAGTTDTTLFNVDLGTNSLVSQKPANNGLLTTIGPLSATQTFTFTGGFDIAGGDDGLAIAALQASDGAQSTLYRVNLGSGAVTAIGPVGPVGTLPLMGLTIRLQ